MATIHERIEELRQVSRREWQTANEAMARGYDADAEIARLRGDEYDAEFSASLAACYRNEPGSTERKDRAYVTLQASRCLDGKFLCVPEKDIPAVRAEVARLTGAH